MMSVMDYTIARINKGEGVWYGVRALTILDVGNIEDEGVGDTEGDRKGVCGY